MNLGNSLKKLGIEQTFRYVYKDPEPNMRKLMDWADHFAGNEFEGQRKAIREVIENKEHPYHDFVLHLFKDVDQNVLTALVTNFFINANLIGWPIQEKLRNELGCNIPWAILLDPTSACNLHCTGCWAAEYGNRLNLTVDEIDDIIRQGKELGVYMYIYTGGEPLVRKKDLIQICEKHNDCVFLSFTNGTLIDDSFAEEMLRVRNFIPAISLEGFEEATDSRRGTGVYQKAVKAMEVLHRYRLPYGISACYTSVNYDSITSEEFYDKLIEMGAYFIWYLSLCAGGSVICVPISLYLPWIFRMTRNMWAAALQAEGDISISMPTEMWIPAFSSITRTPISGKRHCLNACRAPYSWHTTIICLLTTICSAHARCLKIHIISAGS